MNETKLRADLRAATGPAGSPVTAEVPPLTAVPGAVRDRALASKHQASDGELRRNSTPVIPATQRWWRAYSWRLRVTDLLLIVVAVAVAFGARFGLDDPADRDSYGQAGYFWLSLLIVVLWMADLEWCRSRDSRIYGVGVSEYRRVLHSTFRVFGTVAMLMVVFKLDVIRGFFAVALPLGVVLLVAGRWMWRRWLARQRVAGRYLSNVVVLGTPADVEHVITQLRGNLSAGYRVAGVALTSLAAELELSPPWYRVPVLSTLADISRVVTVTGADAVVVAGPLPGGPEAIQQLGWRLEDLSTELVLASSLTNVAGPRVHFRPVEGLPLMHVELPQYSGGKHLIKRAMDIVLSSMALLVLSPIFLVLAALVRRDSAGPVFFRQERVGRNGATFKMIKFRSMVPEAEALRAELESANESDGVLFKIANDPRVTRCGRWMRKYSLDELPQFWNVLLGDMSLVGPRPPLATEVAQYQRPTHRRLLIKPGITGLWQVSGRSTLEWEEAVRLDLYYVENWSFTGDLVILWRTMRAVSSPLGAY